METADAFIKQVQDGQANSNWSVFPMSIKAFIKGIAGSLFLFLIFLGCTAIFLFEYFQTGDIALVPMQYRLYSLVSGLLTVVMFFSLFSSLIALTKKKSNMVILTEDQLIKSWKGRVYSIPYEKITDLKSVNLAGRNQPMPMFGKRFVEFKDTRSNRFIQIGDKDFFDHIDELFTLLNSKIS